MTRPVTTPSSTAAARAMPKIVPAEREFSSASLDWEGVFFFGRGVDEGFGVVGFWLGFGIRTGEGVGVGAGDGGGSSVTLVGGNGEILGGSPPLPLPPVSVASSESS